MQDLRSIGQIAKLQRIEDNDEDFVAPLDMLRELMNDNKAVAKAMREAHEVADKYDDVATTSLLENFIDQAERRTWFLFEASRTADRTGRGGRRIRPFLSCREEEAALLRSSAASAQPRRHYAACVRGAPDVRLRSCPISRRRLGALAPASHRARAQRGLRHRTKDAIPAGPRCRLAPGA